MATCSKKNHDVIDTSDEVTDLLDSLFDLRVKDVIIDVRTPAEFEKGHIIGAKNIPLLNNAERAEVGTLYKQKNPQVAFDRGMELVGPKMASYIKAGRLATNNEGAIIYCWRGGKRSQSMSWLFNMAGLQTKTIPGGYKAYRQYATSILQNPSLKLLVVGGKTGSGKTKVLHALRAQGEQIIDLEGLANHKGSAFGWIGEEVQPSIEHFENMLAYELKKLDTNKPIWIENESNRIGRVALHQDFWNTLKVSPLINIEIPITARIELLVETYRSDNAADLVEAFTRIKKRLGGLNLTKALKAVEENDLARAAEIALIYYDKAYTKLLDKNKTKHIYMLNFDHGDFYKIAGQLIAFRKEKGL